jgi:hypothetical protein
MALRERIKFLETVNYISRGGTAVIDSALLVTNY